MPNIEDELRDELRALDDKIAAAKKEIREADGLDEIHRKEHLEVLLREQKEIVRLEAEGYDESAMGLLAGPEAIKEELKVSHGGQELQANQEESLAPAGAVGGMAVGELIGFLASAAVVAIPGVGQGLAAGAILAAGIGGGAAIGTITGALIGMGADEERAQILASDVEKGNTLLTLETASPEAAVEAADVMRQSEAMSVEIVT